SCSRSPRSPAIGTTPNSASSPKAACLTASTSGRRSKARLRDFRSLRLRKSLQSRPCYQQAPEIAHGNGESTRSARLPAQPRVHRVLPEPAGAYSARRMFPESGVAVAGGVLGGRVVRAGPGGVSAHLRRIAGGRG